MQANPELAAPRPAPITAVPLEENELRAYERTAQAVGFEPAALLEARVLRYLRDAGIPLYPYTDVSAYLARQTRAMGPRYSWIWRPLRAEDQERTKYVWGSWAQGQGRWQNDCYRGRGQASGSSFVFRPYHRAIPLRVLSRVEQIAQAFPEQVQFFVTDFWDQEIELLRGDPFICATAPDMARLVFDVWDEPGFTG